MPEIPAKTQRHRSLLRAILIVGLTIRVIYMLQASSSPYFDSPSGDAAFHDRWAQSIADGHVLGSEPFFRAPLYPYSLGSLYAAFGRHFFVIKLVQHLIGLFAVWLTWRLGRQLFDDTTGLIAAALMAINPLVIYFEDELLLDFLLVPLALIVILSLLRVREKGSFLSVIWSGAAVGLFAVTRPNILLFLPVAVWWVWRCSDSIRRYSRRVIRISLLLAGTALIIAPVTVRNYVVGDDLVLIASQGGVNFTIGNNPEADGVSAVLPPYGNAWTMDDACYEAEVAAGHSLKPSEVSSYWWRKGLSFWITQPGSATKLLVKKTIMFLDNAERANNRDIQFYWRTTVPWANWIPVWFAPLLALSVIGYGKIVRRSMTGKLIVLFALVYSLSVILFFVPARFRLPIWPMLAIGAAAGVLWLIHHIRDIRQLVPWLGGAAVVGLFSAVNWTGTPSGNIAQSYFSLGNAYARLGDHGSAITEFNKALETDSLMPRARLNRGIAYLRLGSLDHALSDVRDELAHFPDDHLSMANFAELLRLKKRHSESDKVAITAIARRPDFPAPYLTLLESFVETGRFREADSVLAQAPQSLTSTVRGWLLQGVVALNLSQLERARIYFNRISDRKNWPAPGIERYDEVGDLQANYYDRPERALALAHYNLGVIDGISGDLRGALHELRQAVELNPGLHEAWANLGTAQMSNGEFKEASGSLQRAISLAPKQPAYRFNFALTRIAQADTTGAIHALNDALAIDSTFQPAVQALQALGER